MKTQQQLQEMARQIYPPDPEAAPGYWQFFGPNPEEWAQGNEEYLFAVQEGWWCFAAFGDDEGFSDELWTNGIEIVSAEGSIGGPERWVKPEFRPRCWKCGTDAQLFNSWLGRTSCPEHVAPMPVVHAFFNTTVEKYNGWNNVPEHVLAVARETALLNWV